MSQSALIHEACISQIETLQHSPGQSQSPASAFIPISKSKVPVERKSVSIFRDVADEFEVKLAEYNLNQIRQKKMAMTSQHALSIAVKKFIESGELG